MKLEVFSSALKGKHFQLQQVDCPLSLETIHSEEVMIAFVVTHTKPTHCTFRLIHTLFQDEKQTIHSLCLACSENFTEVAFVPLGDDYGLKHYFSATISFTQLVQNDLPLSHFKISSHNYGCKGQVALKCFHESNT